MAIWMDMTNSMHVWQGGVVGIVRAELEIAKNMHRARRAGRRARTSCVSDTPAWTTPTGSPAAGCSGWSGACCCTATRSRAGWAGA